MLDVLNTFLEVLHSINQDRQLCIKRYLSIDVGLSVHKTAIRSLRDAFSSEVQLLLLYQLLFVLNCFFLRQEKFLLTVIDVDLKLADDAVLALAVGGAVDE